MALHTVTKGLNLPISGQPEQRIHEGRAPARVALLAADYVGMKPTMRVKEGDTVQRGQPLFEDKKTPGVVYTAPGAGRVAAINRGERRAFQSMVIELSDSERAGHPGESEYAVFESFTGRAPAGLSRDEIRALLIESGLWTALRGRPFGRVANPAVMPHSIFVTAMDTNPLAPSVDVVIEGAEADFERGLICVAKLTEGRTYLCKAPKSKVPANRNTGIEVEEFQGVHPAGTPGFHIHTLDPVHREKMVWYIGYQDVIAIGRLFATGRLDVTRVISLAGPQVKIPRLFRTRLGAAIDDLTQHELKEGENRRISGSALSGRIAHGPVFGYLGRYHNQITVLREGREREFLGWLPPFGEKFSLLRVFWTSFFPERTYDFTTSLNGSKRAMVPIGLYEKVMPMDILPTFLLRALCMGDIEEAEKLGVLELEEEDVALCTFVCPGKEDYGRLLRNMLDRIEKEG